MFLLNSIKISGALLLLVIAQHATAELAKEFVLNDSGRGPYIISKLTGGHLPLTPYYDVTGVKKANEEQVKYTGKEISIGIIGADFNIKKSGLLVNIPFPGDRRNSRHIPSGGVLKNIVYRQDLVGDQFDGTDHPPEITHDDKWCNKRTTRMAGIIGANSETFKGIAPNAKIGVFRVFGCRGHTTTTAVLNALNKAIRQKMNIITLPEIKYVDDKKAELEMAIEQAATAGIILIAAVEQGDSPNLGYFQYNREHVIAVGGAITPYRGGHWFKDKKSKKRIEFTTTCDTMPYILDGARVADAKELTGAMNIARLSKSGVTALAGKVVIADKYQSEWSTVIRSMKRYKVKGMIVTSHDKLIYKCDIPVYFLTKDKANYIAREYKNTEFDFSIQHGNTNEGGKTTLDGRTMPARHLIETLRPDILAPSHDLVTVSESNAIQYVHYSGASAAVAYVAGAAALLLEALHGHPVNSKIVRYAMQNSATPIYEPSSKHLLPVNYQYYGMLNVHKLLHNGLNATPSLIVVTGVNQIHTRAIQLSTTYNTTKRYRIIHKPAGTIIRLDDNTSRVDYSPELMAQVVKDYSVDVPRRSSREVKIGIMLPASLMPARFTYSGYIVFDPEPTVSEEPSDEAIYIPYLGFVGAI